MDKETKKVMFRVVSDSESFLNVGEKESEDVAKTDCVEDITSVESEPENMQEENVSRESDGIKAQINYLRRVDDINHYASKLIYDTYNTHAVTPIDILMQADDAKLNIARYKEPMFSVILQIESDWVKEAVSTVLENWKTKEDAKQYVQDYLNYLGTKPEEMERSKETLISYLSEEYQNDIAPDEYKVFEAVHQLMQQDKNRNITQHDPSEIFADKDSVVDYEATLEEQLEDKVPEKAASANATSAATKKKNDKSGKGIAGTAGSFCGKVISVKYKTAKNFHDALAESMGSYGADYEQHSKEIQERKAEIKAKKQELKHQEKMHSIEVKVQQKADARELKEERKEQQREQRMMERMNRSNMRQDSRYNRSVGGYNQSYGRNNYNNSYMGGRNSYNYGGRNFGGRRLPLPLIIGVINLILGLLTWLIFGKLSGIFAIVGLVIALGGAIRKQLNEPNSILLIIGGYILFIITIIFSIL